jgi:hypothetical protein
MSRLIDGLIGRGAVAPGEGATSTGASPETH